MEIEKRFKINGDIPFDLVTSRIYIEQTYSSIMDKHGKPDVRIRKSLTDKGTMYTHTVKYNTDSKNTRIELEQDISDEVYNEIFDVIDKKPLRKNRYIVPIQDGLVAEIDEFLDKDIIVIEVEFETEDEMNDFTKRQKPDFFGDEIVDKKSLNSMIFSQINNEVKIKFC